VTRSNTGSLDYSYQGDKQTLTPDTVVDDTWTDQGEEFSTRGATGIAVEFTLKPHATLDIDVLKWRALLRSSSEGADNQEQKYAGDAETITVREHKFDPTAGTHLDLTAGVTEVSAYFLIDPAGFEFCQLQIYSEDTVGAGIPTVESLVIKRLQ
tara:strand:- start:454 stop:915 length:462 start_codon:yes stop_codon:yes gene_type:complete